MKNTNHVTIIGGCHALGHFYGRKKGYNHHVQKFLQYSQLNFELSEIVYKTIDKLDVFFNSNTQATPSILILQVGNFEFSPSLRYDIKKKFKKIFGKRAKSNSAKEIAGDLSGCRKDLSDFIPSKKHLFNQQVKHFFNLLIGYRYLNKKKWLTHTDNLFSAIKKKGIEHVLVLSPTPHSGIVTNTYRKIGAGLLQQKSKQFGFDYIDISSLIEKEFKGTPIFIDEGHLNKEVLEYIGEIMIDYISTALKSKPQVIKVENPAFA